MEIFYALCQNDYNTTKAAHALNMTQPAVSLAVKELENYYNVTLFDRIGRKLVITQAGKRFEEYTKSIAGLFSDMEKEMKNWDKNGTIRVGATFTIGAKFLPFYAKAFMESYANTDVKGFCGPAYVLEKKLLDNELDFAFSEGMSSNPSIVSEPYMDDHLIAFAANDGRYSFGQKLSIEEFANSRFVLREADSGTRKVFDSACEKAGFSVEPVWESMSNTGIMSAVASGIGIGILPYRLATEKIECGAVVPLEVDGLDLTRKFYIIHHKDKKLSSAARYFIYLCNSKDFEVPENM
ncbi:MAG: LysR family transcriptional regulator [Oscillospiraceae bacterium]|nr:LysR family transcriptional regulator [Oscillospiraceae bacterium]